MFAVAIYFGLAFLVLTFKGYIKFRSRILTLLDQIYASKYIPIAASVSEHQPTTWSAFFFDLQGLLVFGPLGLYYCFLDLLMLNYLWQFSMYAGSISLVLW